MPQNTGRRTLRLLLAIAGAAGAQTPPSALARDLLAAHNSVRARVKVPPLVWSDQVAAVAQEWADGLVKRHQFSHRPNSKYGENLFEIRGGAASAAQVVDDWASESRDYDYNSNRCSSVCGHYTQVVWSDTKEVGCGMARSGDREVWVCDYNPPGNWDGKKPW
jgi:pathogenesis-related protein 1